MAVAGNEEPAVSTRSDLEFIPRLRRVIKLTVESIVRGFQETFGMLVATTPNCDHTDPRQRGIPALKEF